MTRSRKRNRYDRAELERVLSNAGVHPLGQYAALVRGINPSRLELTAAERASRYAAKAALQSRAIVEHPTALHVVATQRPGIVALRLRSGRGDLGHAALGQLSEQARTWVMEQLELLPS